MLRIFLAGAATLLTAAAVSACGGSSTPAKTTTSATRPAAISFSKCMRANGVANFPDLGSQNGGGFQISASQSSGSGASIKVNGVPVNAPAFQSAMQKCRKDLPKPPPLSSAQITKLRAGALAMAKCMRSHGVPNFPDPVISAGPGGAGVRIRIGGSPGALNPSSPAFQAANQTCGKLIGAGALRIGTARPAAG